jgi:hypothetical protein
MHPPPRPSAARAVPLAAATALLAFAVGAAGAAAPPSASPPPPPLPHPPAPIVGSAWGAPEGLDPCASQDLLERCLAADPALRERRELFDQMVREAERTGLLPGRAERLRASSVSAPTYVIPVAVHIVHQNGPERISNNQVKSQIDALNRDLRNAPGNGAPAVDTKIEFCLATNLPTGSTVAWDSIPGITRANSPETNHIYGNLTSETNLKAIDYLPSDRYLNIWVVKTISGGSGGVAGYATFPGAVPPTLDGIVMRYDVFGSNFIPAYGSVLLPAPEQRQREDPHARGRALPEPLPPVPGRLHAARRPGGGHAARAGEPRRAAPRRRSRAAPPRPIRSRTSWTTRTTPAGSRSRPDSSRA